VLETLEAVAEEAGVDLKVKVAEDAAEYRFDAMSRTELEKLLPRIEREMREASKQLAFEEAARLRDLAIAIRGKLSE
jgi:excinuclease ABC subunit B